ncbi:MAG: carboxylating nicotinate-nucleotide diphosphorylase [Opitutae bacterium]|jgi:nicotinate-nucleotide pyrophosphorylase (carboxylating)|nr:carboxylating nicotinate-nucleotide diphosphorylase [Opitutae bacterium]
MLIVQPAALNEFKRRLSWAEIDFSKISPLLKICVSEDIENKGDVTSEVCKIKNTGVAALVSREEMVVCGLPLIPLIIEEFHETSIHVENIKLDGEKIPEKTTIAYLHGKQKDILLVERTILNFVQRLSGIATLTNQFSSILDKYEVGLLDTRKTTPGHRILEKYATSCGGGYNHRMNLSDRILIKDNHLASQKINSSKCLSSFLKEIIQNADHAILEVEIDQISYLEPAIEAGVDAILLDNFTASDVEKAVLINNNRVVLEASGGINLNTLEIFAKSKPHFISSGAPIHRSRWIDIGLDWI